MKLRQEKAELEMRARRKTLNAMENVVLALSLLIACFFILFSLVPMQRLFSLSKESGRNAAKYIIKQFPQYFDKTFVEPNVPCLMPEILTPQIEGLSEEALKERIHLRRVKDSVDLFDQLVQAGTPVSLETTNSLLDLLCFYGDGESTPEKEEEKENLEEPGASRKQSQRGSHLFIDSRENNNAERIFKIMPERNAHSYCTMIRGMVKVKYSFTDVHTFNALITAVPYLKESTKDLGILFKVFLNHMAQQEVQPNLLTFNALLKTLRRCGGVGKSMSLLVIKEMEALDIGKRTRMVIIFLFDSYPSGIISQVLAEKVPMNFRMFFPSYRSKFFSLLCMMEQIDVVLKWYKEMSPSVFYPTPKNILDLLQALDAANHLEVIPSVWEDMKQLGFNRRHDLLEELLSLMSREQHPHEIQLAFAKCAEDIKAAHEQTGREQAPLEWTGHALGSVAVLFSRAGRTQDAWNMIERFQQINRIPTDQVMNEFLNCAKQTNCPDEAIKLVKLAASLDLPSSQRLKSRTEKEFELSEKQKKTLESIKSDSDSSDSDSDSDSDRD
uniref:Small ribosomal subunit protein mS39 n=1 Tax=Strix occidentalis caurina TaxID=311401 RepID=A0A8D0FWR4_STROC